MPAAPPVPPAAASAAAPPTRTAHSPAPPVFADHVASLGLSEYLQSAPELQTLQINIGKRCNLACKHCHVGATPDSPEQMTKETMEACLAVFAQYGFQVLDITGGAPEMNAHYEWLLSRAATLAHARGGKVITRTNIVIITAPGYGHLPQLWANQGIEVVASLPHYEQRITDRQRGDGVFAQAIAGLRTLNTLGYGRGATSQLGQALTLDLVLNPNGAFLPPDQCSAEREFRTNLQAQFGVSFDHLLTMTNNPTGRFREFLEQRGIYDSYLQRLYNAFNPSALANMMCRHQLSVAWDGQLYDCDFNQVLDWPITASTPAAGSARPPAATSLTVLDLADASATLPAPRPIRFGPHCYACTAGAGSSCTGATA